LNENADDEEELINEKDVVKTFALSESDD